MPICDADAKGPLSIWLKEICLALTADPPLNFLPDVFTPLANIVLAAAAVVVAIMSWRTARRTNDITTIHRTQDREEQRRRWRWTLAVDMKEWESRSSLRALLGMFWDVGEEETELRSSFDSMIDRCNIEGEANGKRLLLHLYREMWDVAQRFNGASGAERAEMRQSAMSAYNPRRALIERWADDPRSIEPELEASETQQKAEIAARLWSHASGADGRTNGGRD